jgi:hypothetical protein
MNLDTFTPPIREEGDRVPAKEMVGRPLVVQVREHRTGVKTTFNSDPADTKRFKPEGGEAVHLDMVDLTTGAVYIGVLWFNGAIVDSLKPYVAQTLPVKLFYDTPKGGGTNPYLNVEPLTANELAAAQQWANANPDRFERERAARAAQAAQNAANGTNGTAPAAAPLATLPAAAPTYAPPAPAPVQQFAPLGNAPAAAPPSVPAAAPTVDVNDPAIQALLAQIAGQQQR